MIRLGRLTDYGIVLMAHLAGAGKARMRLATSPRPPSSRCLR